MVDNYWVTDPEAEARVSRAICLTTREMMFDLHDAGRRWLPRMEDHFRTCLGCSVRARILWGLKPPQDATPMTTAEIDSLIVRAVLRAIPKADNPSQTPARPGGPRASRPGET